VTGFKNPIDTSVIRGFKISTLIFAEDQHWMIDQGETTLQVQEYAQLSQASLEVRLQDGLNSEEHLAGVVQEMNDMQLSFYLPVPLDKGCLLTVKLPYQYSVETITKVGTL
jgi:hypothetical protein